ncbi:hypothetical protein KX928_04840 [Roseobacter sp. YSTF-M11]|uniref:Uncharacterized protein n=1 Tax=Roseobacter insulae TaxID=2859783 RepID=A0A9X1FUG9_9RHOB|nr:hypothetical protein [Roseobacter insulae]MBW4707108.1 hypothetical protein [Roseobacter insulae]
MAFKDSVPSRNGERAGGIGRIPTDHRLMIQIDAAPGENRSARTYITETINL